MRIKTDRLLQVIGEAGLGTGTLSALARIDPDALQRALGTGQASAELVRALASVLEPKDWFVREPEEAPDEPGVSLVGKRAPVAEASAPAEPARTARRRSGASRASTRKAKGRPRKAG